MHTGEGFDLPTNSKVVSYIDAYMQSPDADEMISHLSVPTDTTVIAAVKQ